MAEVGIIDRVRGIFTKATPSISPGDKKLEQYDQGIFKAYIPQFLWKPPYGYPRKANIPMIRTLATTPYVFSVVKTMSDESSSLKTEIRMKEDIENPESWEKELEEAKAFFRNPNGNEESWEHIQRALIRDILEVDAGVLVKVFNQEGKMIQIFARDGGIFLKNPDIYGYLGNREEFIIPMENYYAQAQSPFTGEYLLENPMVRNYYDAYAINTAAYFQYAWTQGSIPVPFGKREICYISANPRTSSIYGVSPVEILADVIMTLHYGGQYHLDFYLNSNIPEGMVSVPGAEDDEILSLSKKFHDKYTVKDSLDNERRIGHKVPFTSAENIKFLTFTVAPKEMQIIEQQQWFSKILWMCFGVTPDEMGITDQSNRAISSEQTKVFKRKAIRPICNVLKYHIDTQVLPEFVIHRFNDDWNEAIKGCPFEFVYDDYDVEEDAKKHNILEQEIRMGVKTPEMVAEELGINIEELKASKEEALQKQQELFNQGLDENGKPLNQFNNDGPPDEGDNPRKDEKVYNKKEKKEEKKSIELKHKYIKRTGGPGHYKYWYQDSKTGKLREGKEPEKKKYGLAVQGEKKVKYFESKEERNKYIKESGLKKSGKTYSTFHETVKEKTISDDVKKKYGLKDKSELEKMSKAQLLKHFEKTETKIKKDMTLSKEQRKSLLKYLSLVDKMVGKVETKAVPSQLEEVLKAYIKDIERTIAASAVM